VAKKRKPRPRTASTRPERSVPAEPRGDKKRGQDKAPPPPPPDVFPSLRVTMARSFVAVTSSPILVIGPMLVLAAIWLALLALGRQIFPASMTQALALPPISSFFFDLGEGAGLFGLSGLMILGFFFLAGLVRALYISVLVGLLDEALTDRSVSRLGVLRGLNGFWGVALYCYLADAIALIVWQIAPLLLGQQTAGTLLPVGLVAGLFFLSFAPAASIRLGVPAREALARAAKGARMSGWQRHLLLVVLYYLVAFGAYAIYPGESITANPTLRDWLYVLVTVFINVLFTAAFIDRWRAVEDYVPRQVRSSQRPVSSRRRKA
jgi:hypothetical protein